MSRLRARIDEAGPSLGAWDAARERLLASSRALVRASASVIRDLHRAQVPDARLHDLDARAQRILDDVASERSFSGAGFVQQALGEYMEARLLAALLRDESELPGLVGTLPVDALLHGIADVVGELRRRLLDRLAADDHAAAKAAFDQMESLYDLLTDAEVPEALVGLRPKRDQARGILERTRGDIMTAKKTKDLEKRIDGLSSLLDEAEHRGKPKPKAKANDDLDLDAAWSKK